MATSPATIVGHCHCRATGYTVSLPEGEIVPLEGTYDHSTDLRLAIGFHCAFLASVPSQYFTSTEDGSAKLVAYKLSTSKTLYFCERCGATLFIKNELDKRGVEILAPTIDISASTLGSGRGGKTAIPSLGDLVVPRRHIFLEETFRGGVSRYMDDGLQRFARSIDGKLWEPEEQGDEKAGEGKNSNVLEGGCHCGGVKFHINRADENYKGDAMLKEWVKPGRKFCASYCFCHSCRMVSGAPFWVWAFVPLKQIHFITDDTYLRIYDSFKDSSRSVTRRFCGRCGCHFFFTSSFTDGKMWDVAIPTLDQRASERDWFVWKYDPELEETQVDRYINSWKEGRMGFENFGREYHCQLVDEVIRGLKTNL